MTKRNQFESDMKAILRSIINDHQLPPENKLNMEALKECHVRRFFDGIVVEQMASGRITCELRKNFWVTKAGYEFLYPKKDWKFAVSTTIALASIVLNIIQFLLS